MIFCTIYILLSWFDWQTLKTDNFTVYYKPGYTDEAFKTLEHLEYNKPDVFILTGNNTRNTPVVVQDVGQFSNGFADPFFYNINIFTYPPGFNSSLEGTESWYRSVLVHEYTHIGHLTKTGGLSRPLTSIFGSIFQSNMYSPLWLIEGIAVYSESQASSYEGRLNDGFFTSYVETCIRDNGFPSIVEVTNTPHRFPYGAHYLYGSEFFNYLAQRYGEDRFPLFIRNYGSYFWAPVAMLFPFMGIDLAANKAYGKNFPALYNEWYREAKTNFQEKHSEDDQVTTEGWYISALVTDGKTIYYTSRKSLKIDAYDTHPVTRIICYDPVSGKKRVIADLTSSVTSPLILFNDYLYFTTRQWERSMTNVWFNSFGITSELHCYNLKTKKEEILITERIRAFCIMPDSSILYCKDRKHTHGSEVWCYQDRKHTLLFHTEHRIHELSANNDIIIAAAAREYENTDLYKIDRDSKTLIPLFSSPWSEGHISFIDDSTIIFCSNYDGKHQLYQLSLKNDSLFVLTDNGFAAAGILLDRQLFYIGLHSNGNDIYRKRYQPRLISLPESPPTKKLSFSLDYNDIRRGNFLDILPTLLPAVRIPLFIPVDDNFSEWYLGALFAGGDPMQENLYATYLAYNSSSQVPFNIFYWQSRFMTPLTSYLLYFSEGTIFYTLAYPVYAQLSPGLSSMTTFIQGRSHNDFARKEITPGISLSLSYPSTSYTLKFLFPFERRSWRSSINRRAQEINCAIKQIFQKGELSAFIGVFNDPDNPDTNQIKLRGYDQITSPQALVTRLEYSHPLVRIRRGLWNPNVFFEDIYGTVFFDFGLTSQSESYASWGLELKIETKIAFGFLQLIPTGGIAMNKNKDLSLYLRITQATANPY